MVEDGGRPPMRYLTLEAARALECNGCGDCCDSRRTDGFWAWGALPRDHFASLAGSPLIIPIERIEDGSGWRDRAWQEDDELPLRPTRFRCTAFDPHDDGTGWCGRHLEPRPSLCAAFPVHMPEIEPALQEHGEYELTSNSLARCTWYRMCIVEPGDLRLELDTEEER